MPKFKAKELYSLSVQIVMRKTIFHAYGTLYEFSLHVLMANA